MDIKEQIAILAYHTGINIPFTFVAGIIVLYYEAGNMPDGPTWKLIAFGSMSIIGALSALTFRTFVGRINKVEKAVSDNQTSIEYKVDANKDSLEKTLTRHKDTLERAIDTHEKKVEKQDQLTRKALASIIVALQTGRKPNFKVEELFDDD